MASSAEVCQLDDAPVVGRGGLGGRGRHQHVPRRRRVGRVAVDGVLEPETVARLERGGRYGPARHRKQVTAVGASSAGQTADQRRAVERQRVAAHPSALVLQLTHAHTPADLDTLTVVLQGVLQVGPSLVDDCPLATPYK